MSDLAERLWHARRDGLVIDAATVPRPATLEEAYAIQRRVTELSGATVIGFKVGSTSIEAQRALGTDRPGSGPLLAGYAYESPARFKLVPAHMPAVEGEFAYRLGRDLPPRSEPYTVEDVSPAIEAVAGAIEIVGTRFSGGLSGKGRLLVTADGGVNIAFVAGRWHRTRPDRDLRAHDVAMRVDGLLVGQGTGERALGGPLNVLAWLAEEQSRNGRGLKAGEIISTGTCTGLAQVAPGQRAAADFGELGTVAVTFD
jgi:2-keto-4-pentenoate hydratase